MVTVSPESTVAQHSGVPWWIILVAVLAGVLILALLVYLLWKVSSVFLFVFFFFFESVNMKFTLIAFL